MRLRKGDIPPKPRGVLDTVVWLIVYHTGKVLAMLASLAFVSYMILCFHCYYQGSRVSVGSKPLDTHLNIAP